MGSSQTDSKNIRHERDSLPMAFSNNVDRKPGSASVPARKQATRPEDRDRILNKSSGFRHPKIDPSRELRLVKFSHNSGQTVDEPAPPHISLIVVKRQDLPATRYRALSYTWDNVEVEADLKAILIDGQRFYVRNNLYSFLQGKWARSNDENSDFMALGGQNDPLEDPYFIDAICINQLDPQEKAQQVSFMNEVYKNADSVMVCIGEICGSSRDFDQELQWSLAAFRNKLHNPIYCTISGGGFNREENYNSHGYPMQMTPYASRYTYCYALLCGRKYWTRLWIVQELLLARHATLVAGNHTFDFHHFMSFPSVLVDMECRARYPQLTVSRAKRNATGEFKEVKKEIYSILGSLQGNPGLNMLQAKQDRLLGHPEDGFLKGDLFIQMPSKTPTFSDVLRIFSTQQCGDSRDRLYGVLGLLPERLRAQIEVSYTTDAVFAFEQALRIGLSEIHRTVDWMYSMQHGISDVIRYGQFLLSVTKMFADQLSLEEALIAKRKVLWELDLRRKWETHRDIFDELKTSTADIDLTFDMMEKGVCENELQCLKGPSFWFLEVRRAMEERAWSGTAVVCEGDTVARFLAYLREDLYWRRMRRLVQRQPEQLETLLMQIVSREPEMGELIQGHQPEFMQFLSGDDDEDIQTGCSAE